MIKSCINCGKPATNYPASNEDWFCTTCDSFVEYWDHPVDKNQVTVLFHIGSLEGHSDQLPSGTLLIMSDVLLI